MSTPLLATKFHIPTPRPQLVNRQRLLNQLDSGRHSKLTLISAPAGFGKTTLVTRWLQSDGRPVAWLSLDGEDSEPTRFISYLIAALQTIQPEIGEAFGDLTQSPQTPPLKSIVTTLLNDLVAQPEPFLLVLDDYHVLGTAEIHEALAFLLDHLPPQMHLVMTTREDPPLPLSRLRVRGQLTEIRAADLRFTAEETADFLNKIMGLTLSEPEIAALERRTEGWIAGLQMAALAMRGRTDTADFVQAFTGSHRFVLDYLVEEVLHSQPTSLRRFLLETSILNRLNGSLCDAVTGGGDSAETLEALERGNLFVVPLDDHRRWYRYHHLFADVLQTYLKKEQPDQIAALHQRASDWYNEHGAPTDAVRHALLAEDFDRAADLIELTWPPIFNGIQPAQWLDWLNALPDKVVQKRPVLSSGFAWTLLDIGEPEAAGVRLHDVEQWLNHPLNDTAMADKMVVANQQAFQSLPASTASARAYWALSLGDIPAAIQHAQSALDLFVEEEHYQRGIAAQFLGLAYWTGGELELAYQAMGDSVAYVRLAGNVYFQVVGMALQAHIRAGQGRLKAAFAFYEQLLQLVAEQNELMVRGAADLYIGLGELYNEWGDVETAVDYLLLVKKQNKQAVLPGSLSRWQVAMARIKMAEGDFTAAQTLLHEVDHLYKQDPFPTVRVAAAMQAQIWAIQGQLAPALDWVKKEGLTATDKLSYLREFEYLTLARILIAQYRLEGQDDVIDEAIHLLSRLLAAAEAGGWGQSVIEALILLGLAYQAQGEMVTAVATIQRAITLAEPEGYVQLFVDEGEPMRELLAACLTQGAAVEYVTRLMQAITPTGEPSSAPTDPNQLLVEPLSGRELEVLALIADGMTNQAIADELVIALSTVKKHVNNIFGKLNVSSRTQAVNRGRDLNIL